MDRCVELETQLMRNYSGLAEHEYRAYYVEISPYCKLRTIEVDVDDGEATESKPSLVFVHGFGASGLMYWRVMKPLAKHYHLCGQLILQNLFHQSKIFK